MKNFQTDDGDLQLRQAMFDHLDRCLAGAKAEFLPSRMINTFEFQGQPIRLIVQNGIRKVRDLPGALTIRTTYTPPSMVPPYIDDVGSHGLVRYKYRGEDGQQSDNRALRHAMKMGLPLAYFVGIARSIYLPIYPVYVEAEDQSHHEFAIAVDQYLHGLDLDSIDIFQREYRAKMTKARLHQPSFRARVLYAYNSTCAICRLHHAELLDAAHILPDGHPRGILIVPNALTLCKLHHAAFDRNLLGIRPDFVVEVKPELLREIDGPMLQHGLKEMNGTQLVLPRERASHPDRARLSERYEEFRNTR
ncbi:HNH endonuclease [Ferrimicrobium sp.]|uniref:HNH endonuclease n=1 Tax=Ferrimicrobium sp. TaxID=2926050 RepID=UPI0026192B88|nr:HNH endonuclease [Ferrimicrobium sp.]